MDDFRSRLKRVFSSREERDKHLAEVLKTEDDLISIVLRGHLVLEELLFAAVAAHCVTPDYLKAANLRFLQLAAILRALQKLPAVSGWLWTALTELNALRNSMAHRLDRDDLDVRVERFVRTIPSDSEEQRKLPPPKDQKDAVSRALHYMLGAMSVVAVFQDAFEELIRQSLIAHAKANPAKKGPESKHRPSK